jgi:hypothetical protein
MKGKRTQSPKVADKTIMDNVHMQQQASLGLAERSTDILSQLQFMPAQLFSGKKLSAKFYVTIDLNEPKILPRTSRSFLFTMIAVILEVLIALLFPPAAVAMVCSFLRPHSIP